MGNEVENKDIKVILNGKWNRLNVKDKGNKTKVFIDRLYVDANGMKNVETINYYNSLIEEGNSKAYSLVRAILTGKSITEIEFGGSYEKIMFEREPEFFLKRPMLRLNLECSDIKKYADEIKSVSIKNYMISRNNFLEESLNDKDAIYYFNTQTYKASYDKNIRNYKWQYNFRLVDTFDRKSLFDDEEFLKYALQSIFEVSQSKIKDDYKIICYEHGKPDYYIYNMKIRMDNKVINIDYLSSELFDEIEQLIVEHNHKLDNDYSKKMEYKGGL